MAKLSPASAVEFTNWRVHLYDELVKKNFAMGKYVPQYIDRENEDEQGFFTETDYL